MVNQDNQTINPSKNFVLPFILLLLSKVSLHGYELSQKLEAFGFKTLDQGNLYRLLRQLEKDELLSSEWDTTGSGPAKRRYSITNAGITFLKGYANQLESYQSLLDQFFKMYSSFFELYLPSFHKKDSIEKVNNRKRRKDDGTEEE
ncbi:helix-turn-helix transcriptional regulator [Bacillus sp. ISL-40]|uniref:helix-turn-helix transcriptional regulator n=1 Tax=unclassified Bacillus (in: firmicutes) TaxID=185979 RepID=UPI001BE724A0|nr:MULTISPECIES: helix-turn-helix transcriptional regulator [unclassified Bacillus (in: firmicutes)]MBT2696986.1 helix-turn-helix transcriptional regulator [Bacillus sp. ISL-40]MBT2722414.1 helix-turn-helix transcriptional regulator [Bacillus sp. ISL-46]MBT2741462.1 helix-turn-helix transcriptional regulator [Bacillus sp. ISL-77]